jgi:hypothetical protein
MTSILFGVIGLVGFEALRLYKSFVSGKALIPQNQSMVYAIIVAVLALFSGACAYALANGNLANSLFVGFSVPTGIRALLGAGTVPGHKGNGQRARSPAQNSSSQADEVEDIEIEHSPDSKPSPARHAMLEYFE